MSVCIEAIFYMNLQNLPASSGTHESVQYSVAGPRHPLREAKAREGGRFTQAGSGKRVNIYIIIIMSYYIILYCVILNLIMLCYIMIYIGALIIRIGFWGPLYYNYNKEPPK